MERLLVNGWPDSQPLAYSIGAVHPEPLHFLSIISYGSISMMLFPSKILLPVVSALFCLQGVVAIPVFPGGTNDDLIAPIDFGTQAPFKLHVPDTSLSKRDALDIDPALLERSDPSLLNVMEEAAGKVERPKYKPAPTKLRIGDGAKQELNRLNLHGKERKNMIKWHKNQVKNHMRLNPDLKDAHTGVIEHLAHKGGSEVGEKNHITASFRDANNKQINNKYNGGRDHHLYVNGNNRGTGRQGKVNLAKNSDRLKGKATNNKGGTENRFGKGSQKNGGKGKGKQRQGGATKKKDVGLQTKKSKGGRK